MRLTKTDVIQAAADIADEHGLNNLSLKNVAEKLNIRTPSLYNHITSLDNLLRAMETLLAGIHQAYEGRSDDE